MFLLLLTFLYLVDDEGYERWGPSIKAEAKEEKKEGLSFTQFEDLFYKFPGVGTDGVYLESPNPGRISFLNGQFEISHTPYTHTSIYIRRKEPSSLELRTKHGKIGLRYCPKEKENISSVGVVSALFFGTGNLYFTTQLIIDRILFLKPPEIIEEERFGIEVSEDIIYNWKESRFVFNLGWKGEITQEDSLFAWRGYTLFAPYIHFLSESEVTNLIRLKIPIFKEWHFIGGGGIDFQLEHPITKESKFKQLFYYRVGLRTRVWTIPYTDLGFYFLWEQQSKETIMIRTRTDWTTIGFRIKW